MDDINTAWMREHTEEDVVGTISCLPGSFIVDNKMQDFISEGWNDAADAAGLEYLAIVSDGLEGIAVKGQIETENVAVEVFDNVEEAVAWMTEQV